MTYTVYILHSPHLNKYYVGKTSLSVEERLQYHLYKHKGFTGKASDWIVVFTEELNTNKEAILFEKKIKNRGAQRFLTDLNAVR